MTSRLSLPMLCALVASTLCSISQANAQSSKDVAVVKSSFGSNCPKVVQTELTTGLETAMKEHPNVRSFLGNAEAKSILQNKSPALDGCLTPECLKRTGTLLNSRYGLSLEVEGQAQIYDFSITIFDLQNGGSTVFSDVDSCDICTPKQARSKIYAFTKTALQSVRLPTPKAATPPKTPPKKPAKPAPNQPARTVDIVTSPTNATIQLEESVLGTGSATTRLPVGSYSLRIEADGHQPADIPLIIDPTTVRDGPITMRLHLAPTSSTSVLVERNPGALDNINHAAIGWTSFGLGVASTVAGGILLSMNGEATCDSGSFTDCPNIYDTSLAGGSLAAVGSVALTSGLFLILWDELAGKPETR